MINWFPAGFASRKLILAAVSLEACPDSSQGSATYQLCALGQTISPQNLRVLICKMQIAVRIKMDIYLEQPEYNGHRGREGGYEFASAIGLPPSFLGSSVI